jgi:hypothetical protein
MTSKYQQLSFSNFLFWDPVTPTSSCNLPCSSSVAIPASVLLWISFSCMISLSLTYISSESFDTSRLMFIHYI